MEENFRLSVSLGQGLQGEEETEGPYVVDRPDVLKIENRSDSVYDGREIFIHDDLLQVDEDGKGLEVPDDVVSVIKAFLPKEDLAIMPDCWFEEWTELRKGLVVCSSLRQAMFDAEMADHGGMIPILTRLSMQADCGRLGVYISQQAFFRRYNPKAVEPTSTKGYLKAANKDHDFAVYQLNYHRLRQLLALDANLSRKKAIIQVIEEIVKTTTHKLSLTEEKALAKSDKEQREREGRSHKKKKKKKSDTRSSSRDSGFTKVAGRQSKKNQQKREKYAPDASQISGDDTDHSARSDVTRQSDTVPDEEAASEEPMDTSTKDSTKEEPKKVPTESPKKVPTVSPKKVPTVSPKQVPTEKPKEPTKKVPKVPVKPRPVSPKQSETSSDSSEDSPSEDENAPVKKTEQIPTPVSAVTKLIWDNANGGFKNSVPASFQHCARGPSRFTLPPEENLYGHSDDEDWCRETDRDKKPSAHYLLWINAIQGMPDSYYSKVQKAKIAWAFRRYDRETRDCPFLICQSSLDGVPTFPTPERFIRHLAETHTHHQIVYQCDPIRVGGDCKGCNHFRRGTLIRHMTARHNLGCPEARKRVMKLHDRVFEAFRDIVKNDGKSLNSSKPFYAEVEETKSGLYVGRVAKVEGSRKFDISSDLYPPPGDRGTFRYPNLPTQRGRGRPSYRGSSDKRERDRS